MFPALTDSCHLTDLQRYLQACHPVPDLIVAITRLESNWILSPLFSSLIRRNAVFLTTIFAGAFAFELCVTSSIHAPRIVSYEKSLTD